MANVKTGSEGDPKVPRGLKELLSEQERRLKEAQEEVRAMDNLRLEEDRDLFTEIVEWVVRRVADKPPVELDKSIIRRIDEDHHLAGSLHVTKYGIIEEQEILGSKIQKKVFFEIYTARDFVGHIDSISLIAEFTARLREYLKSDGGDAISAYA